MRCTCFAVFGAVILVCLAACGGGDGALPDDEVFNENFFYEHDLDEDHVLGGHHYVLLRLEHPGDTERITNGVGFDRLRYHWPKRSEHTFCLLDHDDVIDRLALQDLDDRELFHIEKHGDCLTVTIEEGTYWMVLYHSDTIPLGGYHKVFVHPDTELSEPFEESRAVSEAGRARLMDACVSPQDYPCDKVAVGALESWAPDYIGEPVEGEVIVYSDNKNAHTTTDYATKANRVGPSTRAVKFNGRCDNLAMTGIEFDKSIVGVKVGPRTGVWLFNDPYLAGANLWIEETRSLQGLTSVYPHSASSLWVTTIAQKNTTSVISTRSCIECDLHNVNLSKLNLAGKDLTRANLNGSKLEKTDLTGATLTGCDLRNTRFTDAILKSANLSGARLSGAVFTATNLRGADLSNSFLNRDVVNNYSSATFTDSYMANVDLSNANCTYATFSGVHFFSDGKTATAKKADLSGAIFNDSVLYGVVFDQAVLNGTKFDGANLVNASMVAVSQQPNNSYGPATFYKALLAGTDFSDSRLEMSDFSRSQISRATHTLSFAVMIDPKQAETRTYSAPATVRPRLLGKSVCPDRGSAPCDCSIYPPETVCIPEERWTNPEPLKIVGDNDPDEW